MNSALPLCHEVGTDTRALLTWQQSWAPALQPAKADGGVTRLNQRLRPDSDFKVFMYPRHCHIVVTVETVKGFLLLEQGCLRELLFP